MVSLQVIEEQLKQVGCNYRFWGRPEIRELRNILVPGERIAQAVVGRYENGMALLCVTDHRLLLVDKKPMFLTLEDVRFDMIAEIDYSAQLLEGTIRIMTPNRQLRFTGWNHARLRNVLNYTQQRVTELRQHYIQQQFIQRDEQLSAPIVGSLAIQGNAQHIMPVNPYTRGMLTMRRRRVPKFY
jgi:hypothetical protein